MSLFRQGSHFVLVGAAQLAVDWALFVAQTALGMPTVPANLISRVGGAGLGFWLNGRITFAAQGQPRVGRKQLLRFVIVWLALTAISSVLMELVSRQLGLQMAWLAKPAVEGGLALVSFFLARNWIYR